jgi:nucleoside-diphosphate-sugar epimerase
MRVFLTGATGFIGGSVARALRDRGDDVRALVRDPERARDLESIGVELAVGDVTEREPIADALKGCDAAIHAAAIYEVGVKRSEHAQMYATNVEGAENVLRAALEAGTGRVVYISTVAAFGNTHGEVVEEGSEHSGDYGSYYEETKVLAHRAARRLIEEEGLPCVIVQPGGVYGPGDHSTVGDVIERFAKGRLPIMAFPDLGFNLVHRDDVAQGVLLALDKGEPGQSYVLGGEITTLGGMLETEARILDRRPPKRSMPVGVLKAVSPLGPLVGPLLGFPPNLRELIRTSDGVTFWARHDKAVRELGYSPRPLEQGLRETLEAEDLLGDRAA